MDIDNIIEQTNICIRTLSKLEIENKFCKVSFDKIMTDIKLESKKIVDYQVIDKQKNSNLQKENKPFSLNTNMIQNSKLRAIDYKLEKFFWYPSIRKLARKIYHIFYPVHVIDINDFLRYEGEEFINLVYRRILGREADKTSLELNMQYLKKDNEFKYCILYTISHSKEAKPREIKLKGIWFKYHFYRLKNKLRHIPIVGYTGRIIFGVIMLPKRISSMQKMLINLEKKNTENIKSLHYLSDRIAIQINELTINLSTTELQQKNITSNLYILEKEVFDYVNKTLQQMKLQQKTQKDNFHKLELQTFRNLNQIKNDLYPLLKFLQEKENEKKDTKILKDKFYLRYNEQLMNDSREKVKSQGKIYIDILDKFFVKEKKELLKIIDLGCGECEFVELLNKNGYQAIGVDDNQSVIEKVNQLIPNITIIYERADKYLQKQNDNSIDVISSIHMIEHLGFEEIILFLKECYRTLKSGGLLIVETPNPLNILISTYYFHLDPTHINPIPKELLHFYIEETGFKIKDEQMLRPLNFIPYTYKEDDPIKDIIFRFNMEQAYYIVAVKE